MLPILEREVIEKKHWCSEEELMDYYAIGQCTPGIIAVNTATFIGKKQRGIPGAVIATIGVVTPSVILITLIAGLINRFSDILWVKRAFAGIRVCVCVLIFNAVLKLGKKGLIDLPTVIIFFVVFLGSVFLDLSPVIFVLLAAAAGIVLGVKRS